MKRIVRAGLVLAWAAVQGADDNLTPAPVAMGGETSLPRVLIIGDSISLGYLPHVEEGLRGRAVVEHNRNPDNAGSTARGEACLEAWLGETKWDVIHFNWGLWDICRRVGGKRNLSGPITTPPEVYEERLDRLVQRLRQTGARLIWASTTYCPGGWGRVRGDEEGYNAIAERVMKRHGVPINDLFSLSKSFAADLYKSPGNVHFTEEGYRRLGQQVAAAILKTIEPASTP